MFTATRLTPMKWMRHDDVVDTRRPAGRPRPRPSGSPDPTRQATTGPAGASSLPFLVVFALVLIAPVVYSIYLSLFKEQLIGGNSFVGTRELHPGARPTRSSGTSLGRVALFLVVQVPIMLLLALFAALALDSARLHFTAFFRISIFLPYAVPAVVAALMWGFIYGNRFGLVGNINDVTGMGPARPALAELGARVDRQHRHVGVRRLQHAAVLRRPPRHLARPLRGGRARRRRPVPHHPQHQAAGHPRRAIVIGVIFSIIGSFQLFNEPNILQTLAPERHQHVLHAEHVRLQPVVRGPAVQLLRRDRHHHGRPDDGRRLRGPARRLPEGVS